VLSSIVVSQVTRNRGYEIKTLDNVKLIREVEELQMKLEDIQKGSFKHFMLKEICEQPEVCICGVEWRGAGGVWEWRGVGEHGTPLPLWGGRTSKREASSTLCSRRSASSRRYVYVGWKGVVGVVCGCGGGVESMGRHCHFGVEGYPSREASSTSCSRRSASRRR
jgi:hypothetical protein